MLIWWNVALGADCEGFDAVLRDAAIEARASCEQATPEWIIEVVTADGRSRTVRVERPDDDNARDEAVLLLRSLATASGPILEPQWPAPVAPSPRPVPPPPPPPPVPEPAPVPPMPPVPPEPVLPVGASEAAPAEAAVDAPPAPRSQRRVPLLVDAALAVGMWCGAGTTPTPGGHVRVAVGGPRVAAVLDLGGSSWSAQRFPSPNGPTLAESSRIEATAGGRWLPLDGRLTPHLGAHAGFAHRLLTAEDRTAGGSSPMLVATGGARARLAPWLATELDARFSFDLVDARLAIGRRILEADPMGFGANVAVVWTPASR